jgi:uncharacterized membrane protein SpoIIM required for sporulation
MIVDLERFIARERPGWERLDSVLKRIANDPWRRLSFAEVRELDGLYQRAASDLARLGTFSAEVESRQYLEGIVARAYTEIHGANAEIRRFRPWHWFSRTFPATWRKRAAAFWFAMTLMVAGVLFGGAAIGLDPGSKDALMAFPYLRVNPAERVAHEESMRGKQLTDRKARFSGNLITNNTRVTLEAMALGMTWGIGTIIIMFYNGVILGAIAVDYILSGQTSFLVGWLLPHGAVEVPAMLVGGQAGFVLAGALLGRGEGGGMALRLRRVVPDVVTLCFGAALMLVWAGIVEAFFSQYHEPILPYAVKITFGVTELAVLIAYLSFAGRGAKENGAE